ncbi:MAG: LUD domain-containing protein [Allobaculum sp.]|nr:LUD domain-containing protein [Allobaculum sp.]
MDFSTVKKNLEARGYKVRIFETAKEATQYLNEQIDQKTVGFGGSVTLAQMNLMEALQEHNTVFWHNRTPQGEDPNAIRQAASQAEVYVSSVNGLAESGEIINIDGTCNRLASLFYGHDQVYLVIGQNKLAKDYDQALFRARNVAAPLNAKRVGVKTPCAIHGDRCYDCKSPERICRGLLVLWEKPNNGARYEIVLVNEDLGY